MDIRTCRDENIITGHAVRINIDTNVPRTGFYLQKDGPGEADFKAPDMDNNRYANAVYIRGVVRSAMKQGVSSIVLDYMNDLIHAFSDGDDTFARMLGEQLTVAAYEFRNYKTEHDLSDPVTLIETIYILNIDEAAEKALRDGEIIGKATNFARSLANAPPGEMTPERLAEAAKEVDEEIGSGKFNIDIFEIEDLKKMELNLLVAVGQGAENEPRLIEITYDGADDQDADPIILVGKGITFDTGGLDLKPADGMFPMKMDMTGGAVVIAVMKALAQLGVKKNVVGIVAAAENAISHLAYRPSDIVTSLEGITVEIGNTDAEGRLVLADAITYAGQNYTPCWLATIATLTGAAHIAMGDDYTAFMTADEGFEVTLRKLGKLQGTNLHPLPLDRAIHRTYFRSSVADISNVRPNGNRYGGASVGAAFLDLFAEKAPVPVYAHFDIAPTMESAAGQNLAEGATGILVGFFVSAIMDGKL